MKPAAEWINICALALAICASMYAAVVGGPGSLPPLQVPAVGALPTVEPTTLPDGQRAVADATGTLVPLRSYRRIASGSLLADPLLLALCSPEEIIAFSGRAPLARDAHRYAGKPHVDATHRLEELVALQPDLVLVNSLGEHAWVQRLRDAGLTIFDLGPMWGVETFLRNVAAVGLLVGRSEAARELAWRFEARLKTVANDVSPAERRSALYVGVAGNQMFGGTRGSSYHDVLSNAGLRDVAAAQFRGWPVYSAETLLELDPEIIVTALGGRSWLCGHTELRSLRSCRAPGGVIEIGADLLSDAGLGMLDAAEEIYRAAYPKAGVP